MIGRKSVSEVVQKNEQDPAAHVEKTAACADSLLDAAGQKIADHPQFQTFLRFAMAVRIRNVERAVPPVVSLVFVVARRHASLVAESQLVGLC